MLYSQNLNSVFAQLDVTEYSEALEEYVLSTFFTPNDLNSNTFSVDFLRSYSAFFKEVLKNLDKSEVTSDLPTLFLTLFNKNNSIINQQLILCSKTKFLQLISGAFVYGLLCEVKDFPNVREKDYNFLRQFNIGNN